MTTRLKILSLLFIIPLSIQTKAQDNKNLVFHPDRYLLILPPEWNKTKMIAATSEVLSQTIDELKDKDFCTEGRAIYNVHLYIDSVTVSNQQTAAPIEIGSIPHFNYSFDYSFNAGLLVTDTSNKSVAFLRLVSGDEVMTYSSQITTRPQNVTYRYEPVVSNTGRVMGRRLVQDVPAVTTYVPQLNAFAILSQSFLADICAQKLLEMRKTLKKLNQDGPSAIPKD